MSDLRFRCRWMLPCILFFHVLLFLQLPLFPVLPKTPLLYVAAGYILLELLFLLLMRVVFREKQLTAEFLACFLCGLSVVLCGSVSFSFAWKQLAAVALGMAVYFIVLIFIADPDFAMRVRPLVAVAAGLLLVVNLIFAGVTNGQRNWITLGSFSLQPSELVKIAFVFVGAATLDRLQKIRSITRYLIFACFCVGALFLMRDFGTAFIFFATFLIIAFLRAGDLRTIIMLTAAMAMGVALVFYFRPYVADRFLVYRHVWAHIQDTGYQQTRVLIYGASGGLFGLGLGAGKLRQVYASTTDLIFGVVAEELGLVVAFLIPAIYLVLLLTAVRRGRKAQSAFYAISAISAAVMLLIQASLNIFGITDLLPLTGVTLPFISRGGSSMLCAWGLLAFIRGPAQGKPRGVRKTAESVNLPTQGDIPISKGKP